MLAPLMVVAKFFPKITGRRAGISGQREKLAHHSISWVMKDICDH